MVTDALPFLASAPSTTTRFETKAVHRREFFCREAGYPYSAMRSASMGFQISASSPLTRRGWDCATGAVPVSPPGQMRPLR